MLCSSVDVLFSLSLALYKSTGCLIRGKEKKKTEAESVAGRGYFRLKLNHRHLSSSVSFPEGDGGLSDVL